MSAGHGGGVGLAKPSRACQVTSGSTVLSRYIGTLIANFHPGSNGEVTLRSLGGLADTVKLRVGFNLSVLELSGCALARALTNPLACFLLCVGGRKDECP